MLRGCLFAGVPVSAAGMMLAAAVVSAVDLPPVVPAVLAGLSVAAGAFLGGASAGRRARRHGWRKGCGTALLLTALWYGLCCGRAGALLPPGLFGVTVPAGMLGGVLGVNRPAPGVHRRVHGLAALPARAKLSRAFVHKPKKQQQAQAQDNAAAART